MKTITMTAAHLNVLLKASKELIFNSLDDKLEIFSKQYPKGIVSKEDEEKMFEMDISDIDDHDKREIIPDLRLMSHCSTDFEKLKEVADLLEK